MSRCATWMLLACAFSSGCADEPKGPNQRKEGAEHTGGDRDQCAVDRVTRSIAFDEDAALAGAIARNVFPDDTQDSRAPFLAAHVQSALAAVRGVSLADLQRGDVAFPNLAAPMTEETGI